MSGPRPPPTPPALSVTLPEAFQSDPVLEWRYPDEGRRTRIVPEALRAFPEHTVPHGDVDTVRGEVSGAIWVA